MAKKPESISILGRQLVGEAQERGDRLAREEAKRQEKGAIIGKGIGFGLDIFKKVGDQVLGRTNEQFLKQENFYARQAIFDVNLKQDQNHMNFWNERLAHKGGEELQKLWSFLNMVHLKTGQPLLITLPTCMQNHLNLQRL